MQEPDLPPPNPASMRFRMCVVIVLAAAAAALPTQPAIAAPESGCGGAWTETDARCSFVYLGMPIRVWGNASAPDVAALTVTVEYHVPWLLPFPPPGIPDPPVPGPRGPVLLVCAAAGTGSATCSATLGPEQASSAAWQPGATLVCRVHGAGAGAYGCASGGGAIETTGRV